ncbi:hypothetical protein Rifp1Sym_cw00010 [endosymbiont of Riftia pachyptila (vent Ph05)]|uniref:Thiamine-binding protein domain-containing protein n=1 Tax=endosymbiont of Riftia pachyptila (vent Ph05) TaxID=1048808 RepID=G2DFP7_9GAMM|nr:hypothetical protein Rifp1Sym_cw00010 [endosymbiont of Riftia pachyptila (vent Ph05)]
MNICELRSPGLIRPGLRLPRMNLAVCTRHWPPFRVACEQRRAVKVSVLLEFSMFPTDQGESVSEQVSQVIAMIRDSGVDYQLTPMGTIIETAELGDALALVERAYQLLERQGCRRVYSSLKLDIRQGKDQRLAQKIRSVEEKIGTVRS